MSIELEIAFTRARMVASRDFDRAVAILSRVGMALSTAAHYVLALLRVKR